MMFSKKFSFLFLSAGLLALAGCTSETSPYWGKEVAEFKVATPSAEIVGEITKDSFNFDQKANFNFRACLSDLNGGGLPPGLDFAVQVGSGEEILAKTDIDSCINWEREIGFTQLKAEKYYLLKTKFISKNKLKGVITLDLLLNPISSTVTDMRNISASKRREIEEVKNEPINIQNITDHQSQSKNSTATDDKLPSTNAITGQAVTSDYTVVIDSVRLEKIRLDIDKPFTVDEHLNLTTNNTFLVSVSPQFIVKRFGNPFEKIVPTKGQFKITLAFLAEPDFKVDDLFYRVQSLRIFEDVKKLLGTSKRQKEAFDLNIQRYLKEKENELKREMSNDDKRLLMGRLMLPFLHQTVQTIAEMTPQFGLQKEITVGLDQLALFPRRAMIAVTVEPIGPEIKKQSKADGAGYVSNLYAPAGVSQFAPYKLEADLIHLQKTQFSKANPVKKPLDVFQSIATSSSRIYPMNTQDVRFKYYSVFSEIVYPTSELLKLYFNNQASLAQKTQLLRVLCHKIFTHENVATNDTRTIHSMRKGCESSPSLMLDIAQLDFIDQLKSDRVDLVGPVIANSISINQSFSKSANSSRERGSTTSASAGVDLGLNLGLGFDFLKVPGVPSLGEGPLSMSAGASAGFKASVGQTWYYTSTRSKSTRGSTDSTLSSGFKISIEGSTFEVNAKTQRCLIVKTNDDIQFNMAKRGIRLPLGVYVCDRNKVDRTYREDFYLVKQECVSSSPLADCSSDQENRFTMMIRGRNAFKLFENMVQNLELETSLMPVSSETLKKQIQSWETQVKSMATTQVFPGALVIPTQK